jgi:transposase InsO family protein
LKSKDVLGWLRNAIKEHGAPAYLWSDNGPEFIANTVQGCLRENEVRTLYIEPGSPWQNGFVESFHGRFRDKCLNREQLHTLTEAQVVIGDYREEYNRLRPHRRPGYPSPAAYAETLCPSPFQVGLRPPSTGDGQTNTEPQPSTSG